MVGAGSAGDGCVGVDAHMRTSVDGVYAAGDLVIGLDQISNAMGQGGVAATTIRNDLAEREPIRCYARNSGSRMIRSPSRRAIGSRNGISERLPFGRSTSSRSPAPKFSTATTRPNVLAGFVDAGQSDQVGVIIFALLKRRQVVAVDFDQLATQRLGGGAVGDALETGDGGLAAVLDVAERQFAPADVEMRMASEALDAVREQLEPQLALHPMRPGDRGQRHALRGRR